MNSEASIKGSKVDVFDHDFLKREILSMSGVVYAGKVKTRILKSCDMYLDEHEERSLGRHIGVCLSELYSQGKTSEFSKSAKGEVKYVIER